MPRTKPRRDGGAAVLIQNSDRMNSMVTAPWKTILSGNHTQKASAK